MPWPATSVTHTSAGTARLPRWPDGRTDPAGQPNHLCADAWMMRLHRRSYRRGASPAEGPAEIRSCSGTQFDPRVVDALARAVRARFSYRWSAGPSPARCLPAIRHCGLLDRRCDWDRRSRGDNESGLSPAGLSQVRSPRECALSSTHLERAAALTPKISTNRRRPAARASTPTDGASHRRSAPVVAEPTADRRRG